MGQLEAVISLFICKDIKAYVGKEGLFDLWLETLKTFQEAVIERHMNYDRFREDFINSHIFPNEFDNITRNNHMVNVSRINSLISNRKDLLYKYSKKKLDQNNFTSCMNDFMFIPTNQQKIINFECLLSKHTLSVIAEAVNDIPLFTRKVDNNDMNELFNKCISPEESLVANNNGVIGYFFSCLNYKDIISRMYEYVIANNKLIKSSSCKKYLSQEDLAVALSRFHHKNNPIKAKIDWWCGQIKKSILDEK